MSTFVDQKTKYIYRNRKTCGIIIRCRVVSNNKIISPPSAPGVNYGFAPVSFRPSVRPSGQVSSGRYLKKS